MNLAELTTMRVGGPAQRVIHANTREELILHTSELLASGDPWILLGGGSNTVVSDEGFAGTVLLVRSTGVQLVDDHSSTSTVRLRVQAGHDWDRLVAHCTADGLAGLEALSGIPGSVGAAPMQNIGAYGAELSDVLHSIEFFDAHLEEVVHISAAELELGYRDSALKHGREGVVLSIDLELEQSDSAPIRYEQLANALGVNLGDRVPLAQVREHVLTLRAAKGMVLRDDDHDTWSAGSFFINPMVSEHFARTLPHDAPRFEVLSHEPAPAVTTLEELELGFALRVPPPAHPRTVKLSAAWLIERAGITRGFRLPGSGAAISHKHTLAITNRGGATAADVAQLARYVVQRVQQEFGIILTPEPNLYGLEL